MNAYNSDHSGMAELLQSEMLMRVVEYYADDIMNRAIAMAPVGDPAEDEHPGRYKASFHVRSHRYGGATRDVLRTVCAAARGGTSRVRPPRRGALSHSATCCG